MKSGESASSLQLTLENNKISAVTDKYVMKLLPSASSHQDVIGFVFAINGRIKTGDIYGSHELFQQVWPRLLQAAAVEAFADFDAKHSLTPTSREEVASFLVYASKGLPFPQDVSKSTRLVLHPRQDSYFFETFDPAQKDLWFQRL